MIQEKVQPQFGEGLVKQQNYEYCYDPTNLSTLVILKKVQKIPNLNNQSGEVFPNFISMLSYSKANMNMVNLKGMISQPVANQAMILQFCKLARQLYPKNIDDIQDFEELFLKIIKPQQLQQQEVNQIIISYYIKNTVFHRLLNNILRSSTSSSQMYYGHYFVQHLFKQIQTMYAKHKVEDKRSFMCYRGARLEQNQVAKLTKFVGGHIYMLGFLSTSLSEYVALQFAQNALFEIQVPIQQRDLYFDHGYADLSSINHFQKQVLFNALCCFQIVKIDIIEYNELPITKVKLIYGRAAAILNKYLNDHQNYVLAKGDKEIVEALQYQRYKLCKFDNNQCQIYGQVVSRQLNKLQALYLQKYLQLNKQIKQLANNNNNKNNENNNQNKDKDNDKDEQYSIIMTTHKLNLVINYQARHCQPIRVQQLLQQISYTIQRWQLQDKQINNDISNNTDNRKRRTYHKYLQFLANINKSQELDNKIAKQIGHIQHHNIYIHDILIDNQALGIDTKQQNQYRLLQNIIVSYITLTKLQLCRTSTKIDGQQILQNIKDLKALITKHFSDCHPLYRQVKKIEFKLYSNLENHQITNMKINPVQKLMLIVQYMRMWDIQRVFMSDYQEGVIQGVKAVILQQFIHKFCTNHHQQQQQQQKKQQQQQYQQLQQGQQHLQAYKQQQQSLQQNYKDKQFMQQYLQELQASKIIFQHQVDSIIKQFQQKNNLNLSQDKQKE